MCNSVVSSFGEAGIRLFLLFAFTLSLLACVAGHVDAGCFVSPDVPEQHHPKLHPGSDTLPAAELQEEEFDEAVVPKTLHEDLPVFELFEPLRLIRFALRRSPCSTLPLFGGIRARAPSSTPAVLRC